VAQREQARAHHRALDRDRRADGRREIARELGLDPREAASIYEDLEHIARSLKNSGFVLLVQPPACKSCGYVFRDLKRLKKPSKCPRCRSERIYPPRFIIRPRDERG